MEDLESDPGEPSQEEQGDDVRVDQDVQELREEARVRLHDLRVRGVQRDVAAVGLEPVDLVQERGKIGYLQVDHVDLERLVDGEVGRLPNRASSPGSVAAIRLRERPQLGGEVVDHLPAQVAGEVAA